MKKSITLFSFLLLLTGMASAQASKNINLIGHIAYNDICSDVVGYSASGVEYAILGHAAGTSIISLATPSNPVVLFEIPGINTEWHEVDLYQHYAYVVNEGGDGLRIIDLSGLPGSVQHKDTVISGMTTGHSLMISGDRLYVFGGNIANYGAGVFSLTDPWRPTYLGGYDTHYVHDAYVRGDTCYMGEIYDGIMEMVDMRNPAAPVPLGAVTTPDQFTHNSWLNDAGNICFTTDEVNAAYVAAYDVSDPNNIFEVSRYRGSLSQGQSIPHNVKVLNDFLVTSYYKDGVNIADASHPGNLIEVGYYDTCPLSGPGFDGNWGLDCYLPSGLILVADMSSGFFVLDPTYVRGCYLEGIVTDVSNGQPINGASVTIVSTPAMDLSNNAGDYATGLADAGAYTVRYSMYGYRDTVINVNLSNGILTTRNIALRPNPRVGMLVNVIEQGTNNPIPNAKVSFLEVTSGLPTDYIANGQGQVVDNNFMSSNYHLIAGDWGHVTQGIDTNITALNNTITIALPKGYYDDFAFDFGWTASGNASGGMWERGEPVGTIFYNIFANPEHDDSLDFGNECFVTGNQGGDPTFDDVDGGYTMLTSPVMDLSGYTNPWLIFDYWFLTVDNQGQTGFRDSLLIEIDNGSMVQRAWWIRDVIYPLWQTDTIQIASFLPFTSTTTIRVRCTDRLANQIVEGAIDKIRIEDQNFVGQTDALDSKALLQCFPNPSHGTTKLRFDLQGAENGSITITDMHGRTVKQYLLTDPKGVVNMDEDLATGIFFATLKTGDTRLATQKIVRY